MATSTGKVRTYVRAGKLSFEIHKKQSLTLFRSTSDSNHYFLPFRDATSGVTTYGGGRYLDMAVEAGGWVVLDFNYAYNPFCAYNDDYDCPIPPAENSLSIPIEAGEKAYARKH